jgi:chorismate mutase / prephenate dehydratase
MTDAFVAGLRDEIDEIDRGLLAAINRRLATVRRLHDYKQAEGLPLRDPGREATLLTTLAAANTGPLSAEGVADFFEHVLELTRRELHGE